MKFLANENIPLPSVFGIREGGWDIVSVTEEASGSSDEKVLDQAHRQGRIVLTFDRDYGELIFKQKASIPAGVVYFRFDPDYPREVGEIILLLLGKGMIFENYFTVLTRENIRQRRLL